MTTNLIELLKEALKNPANATPEKLKGLVNEAMGVFQELKGKFASENPEDKEEAMLIANELKQGLEEQMKTLSEITGQDVTELAAKAETAPFSFEEKEVFDELKKMGNPSSPKVKAATKHKLPNLRFIG